MFVKQGEIVVNQLNPFDVAYKKGNRVNTSGTWWCWPRFSLVPIYYSNQDIFTFSWGPIRIWKGRMGQASCEFFFNVFDIGMKVLTFSWGFMIKFPVLPISSRMEDLRKTLSQVPGWRKQDKQ